METTRKIGLACFIGGASLCFTALMFAPRYWLLAIVAGFAGGYVSYEFREILRTIPMAFRIVQREMEEQLLAMRSLLHDFKQWMAAPHPFGYLSFMAGVCFYAWAVYNASPFKTTSGMPASLAGAVCLYGVVFPLVSLVVGMVSMLFIEHIALTGAYAENCTFEKSPHGWYDYKPLTYRNAFRWLAKGIGFFLFCIGYAMWPPIGRFVWQSFRFLGRFLWTLFKLVHSEKRLLCAIDGTLGGIASYVWLGAHAVSLGEQAIVVVCGGLFGAALGILNWEIVSKRILRLAPVNGS